MQLRKRKQAPEHNEKGSRRKLPRLNKETDSRLQDAAQALLDFGKSTDSILPRRQSRHRSCKVMKPDTYTEDDVDYMSISESDDEDGEFLMDNEDLDDDDLGDEVTLNDEDTEEDMDNEPSRKRKSSRKPITNPYKKPRRSSRLAKQKAQNSFLSETGCCYSRVPMREWFAREVDKDTFLPDYEKLKTHKQNLSKGNQLHPDQPWAFETVVHLEKEVRLLKSFTQQFQIEENGKSICAYDDHHIIIKSLGGADTSKNLASLKRYEHFAVHIAYSMLFSDMQVDRAVYILTKFRKKDYEKFLKNHPHLKDHIENSVKRGTVHWWFTKRTDGKCRRHKFCKTRSLDELPWCQPCNDRQNNRTKSGRMKCQHKDGCDKGEVDSTGRCSAHGGGKRCKETGCKKGARGATNFCSAHGGGKRCKETGCKKGAQGATNFCKSHGGGRRCKKDGCGKSAVGATDLCSAHGGGKRCKETGCKKGAQGATNFCKSHGGGRRCKKDGCGKSARCGTDLCSAHGGGKRCKETGCLKGAQGATNLCSAHGGGKRCTFPGCETGAAGATNFCTLHGYGFLFLPSFSVYLERLNAENKKQPSIHIGH